MKIAFFILTILFSTILYAQEKIKAERPSETIDADLVSPRQFQAEFGVTGIRANETDKIWRTPNAVFRYGILDKIELRLETSIEKQDLVSEQEYRHGLRPIEVGLKANIFKTKNEAFNSSIVAQVGLSNFASTEHTSDNAYHRIRLLVENKLTDKISLGYNLGTDWDSEGQEQNYVYTFTPSVELSKKLDAFVEVYGFFQKEQTPENMFDAGLAYYVSNSAKLDASAGIGLNSESPHYFLAVGFSFCVGGKKHDQSHAYNQMKNWN